ncbi:MAG: hypothetical protein DMG40_24065 [Acidobacteria bacterium]|nr:MAG: hypothetical protein DMG40_24065 [Acidobacteriota bacterium]
MGQPQIEGVEKFKSLRGRVRRGEGKLVVAEKIGVMETAAEFLKKRRGTAKEDGLMKLLHKVEPAKARLLLGLWAISGLR